METFLEDNNIAIRDIPFGLAPANKSTPEDVEIVNKEFEELEFTLPEDYTKFCIAHGGGTLGRTKMFVYPLLLL